MSKQFITVEIEYDDSESTPEVCADMSVKELSEEFESNNRITSIAFYNALTNEDNDNG